MTRLFRFVDDVAIRVRPRGAGSVVDLRSNSRVGGGDLGANAERIAPSAIGSWNGAERLPYGSPF